MAYPTTGTIATLALGATVSSSGVSKENYLNVYVQGVVTSASSLNVSIAINVSADNTNWVTLTTPAAQVITANGTYGWIIPSGAYKYWRITSTRTAGTGSFDVTYNMQ